MNDTSRIDATPHACPDFTTRRGFLGYGLTVGARLAATGTLLGASTWAVGAPQHGRKRSDDRVLVVLQLGGGNDGLNTVVPIGDDRYRKARPRLAVSAKAALRLDDTWSLHPSLDGLKRLHDDGLLAIVHGVGYPNPNRSHFESMDIWHTASPEGRLHTGWLGRYLETSGSNGKTTDPLTGVALMGETPLAMCGKAYRPVTFQQPDSLRWRSPGSDGMRSGAFTQLNQPARRARGELTFVQESAREAQISAERIRQAAEGRSPVQYPGSPVATSLKQVARMIANELPARIYYVSHGGYDTHSGQAGRHEQLLTQLGGALQAFVGDLKATGQLDRVAIVSFSEFGRRVEENASGGTDHGEAGPVFLLGSRIRPGFHGTPSDLGKLHRGDLAHTTDFRRVYAAVLQKWLDTRLEPVLGGAFEPLPLFAERT